MNEWVAGVLLRYLQLLQRWNATYNLTAVREPAAIGVFGVYDTTPASTPVTDGGK